MGKKIFLYRNEAIAVIEQSDTDGTTIEFEGEHYAPCRGGVMDGVAVGLGGPHDRLELAKVVRSSYGVILRESASGHKKLFMILTHFSDG